MEWIEFLKKMGNLRPGRMWVPDETKNRLSPSKTFGWGPARAAFGYLGLKIEDFFVSGTAPNPVERALLASGILEAAMISGSRGGERMQTPHLSSIRYRPGKGASRPSGSRPKGASIGDWIVHKPGATPEAQPILIKRGGTVRRPRPTN